MNKALRRGIYEDPRLSAAYRDAAEAAGWTEIITSYPNGQSYAALARRFGVDAKLHGTETRGREKRTWFVAGPAWFVALVAHVPPHSARKLLKKHHPAVIESAWRLGGSRALMDLFR